MSHVKTTPMMRQYLDIKAQYADSILFYRMGDFYEMFFEDAQTASKVLEITLTSRNKNNDIPVPMCGFPHKAAQGYIARLIENGFKVAICDQIEDPAEATGIVKREVVRVITPGMVVENELLDAKSNNYLLAISKNNNMAALSYLDISTGEFKVCESNNFGAITDEILRVSPREFLVPESLKTDLFFKKIAKSFSDRFFNFLDDKYFELKKSRERLLEQFKTLSLEGFGADHLKEGVKAAGALVYYIKQTQKQTVSHLSQIEPYSLDHYLIIDDISCRNLELITNIRTGSKTGTLFSALDNTVTSMGGRMLKNWIRYPLLDENRIQSRLDAIDQAKEQKQVRRHIRDILKTVYDLERLSSKIVMGHCNAKDLVALKNSFAGLPDIFTHLLEFKSTYYHYDFSLEPVLQLGDLIDQSIREDAPHTINEGGMIKKGYDAELDELILISQDGKGYLAALETKEKNSTGINSLKVRYNKVFGYYIEVPKTHQNSIPAHYVRKQTLVNAERYITDELKTFEEKVLGAEERRAVIENKIFHQIRAEVVQQNDLILKIARFIARLDCILNLAQVADDNDYLRPKINQEGIIRIDQGRHPVIEKMLTAERFVPNTIHMDNENIQVMVITGPNMAGKSTILRQVAISVLMAQMGSFVPASSADICIIDRIFTRVGALDNLSQGQSTFMVEMQETANILNNATENSLIIMDEIGRGTSTFDGLSIAWAVAEYLHDFKQKGIKTLFATHYHELTDLALTKNRVKNFNIAVKEWNDEIIFLRKIVEGGTNRSYGIQVARLAGIPDKVIKRSKKILGNIEKGEYNIKGLPAITQDDIPAKKKQVQLSLFQNPEQKIISKLQKMDLSTVTPLDALNILNELKEKARDILI